MTPRGLLAYLAGLLLLVAGLGLAGLILLFAVALPPRPWPEAPILLLVSAVVVFGASHFLAAGVYRMLVHLYHAVSRTDPAGDRPLRGRTLYVLGQLAIAMTVPTTMLFARLTVSEEGHQDRQMGLVLMGVLPAGFLLTLAVVAFFGGLGIMLRDLFLRNREIVEKTEIERRRRLEEHEESQTEVIPLVRPAADELREHIKEDR